MFSDRQVQDAVLASARTGEGTGPRVARIGARLRVNGKPQASEAARARVDAFALTKRRAQPSNSSQNRTQLS